MSLIPRMTKDHHTFIGMVDWNHRVQAGNNCSVELILQWNFNNLVFQLFPWRWSTNDLPCHLCSLWTCKMLDKEMVEDCQLIQRKCPWPYEEHKSCQNFACIRTTRVFPNSVPRTLRTFWVLQSINSKRTACSWQLNCAAGFLRK